LIGLINVTGLSESGRIVESEQGGLESVVGGIVGLEGGVERLQVVGSVRSVVVTVLFLGLFVELRSGVFVVVAFEVVRFPVRSRWEGERGAVRGRRWDR
jgi:hypothetical protein